MRKSSVPFPVESSDNSTIGKEEKSSKKSTGSEQSLPTMKPVIMRPKTRDFEAMWFSDFQSLFYIIPWLKDSFYALTDGETIMIDDHPIKSVTKKPEDVPLQNLVLVISDPTKNNLLVVQPGYWIVYSPIDGYAAYSEQNMRARFDIQFEK